MNPAVIAMYVLEDVSSPSALRFTVATWKSVCMSAMMVSSSGIL